MFLTDCLLVPATTVTCSGYYKLYMPYKSLDELPETVKEHLPHHGQEIYLAAYNSAWEQYDQPEERREGRDREETAHAVAWSAVENSYEKNDQGQWVEKKKAL